MLEKIYKSQSTIKQLRSGSLGKYVDSFASHFVNQGYNLEQASSRFGVIGKLSIWLTEHKVDLCFFDDKQIRKFIKYRKKSTSGFVRKGDRKILTLLIEHLRDKGVIPSKANQDPEDGIVDAFVETYALYLKEEKGLYPTSVKRSSDVIHKFLLKLFDKHKLCFQELSRRDILAYISDCHECYSSKYTQVIASELRSFLNYLVMIGEINSGLAGCIPAIPCYRAVDLPEFLNKEEVNKLLSSCDRHTAVGSRNYAILLLLSRLGLRACEVIKLSLDNIRWSKGEIEVFGKQNKRRVLPLPHEVGEALSCYLKNYRPNCSTRQVFIRTRAPIKGLKSSNDISSIVRRALSASGLSPIHKGAHLLRYTAATASLQNGATLFEIGELLGHCSQDTTALYTKVDVARLKELALPWPK